MVTSIGHILPRAARKFGEKIALVCGDRSFSFRALDELSGRLAGALRGLGLQAGDRITLYSQNGWEWVVSYYAIARLGGVINPVNVMLAPAEVAYIIRNCGARAVLASSDKGETLLELRDRTPLEHVVLFGECVPAGAWRLEDLLGKGCADDRPVEVESDAISTIAYTSGTTGYPKGAALTHRNVVLNSALTANLHVRKASDVAVTALPTTHVYGNVILNGAFLSGMTLVLLGRFNEVEALRAIERHRATLFEGVPTMYLYMLNSPELGKSSLASLERCTVGGQPMPVAKMREVESRFGCPLLELWGMTEIAGLGTTHPFYGENRHGSIGIPLPSVQCRIADLSDPSRTLPEGEVGELMVRGPIVMKGYYRNPEATRETIEPNGWLHTGDLAYMDEHGYFYIVDRKKDMILTAGYNIYPAEIERVLAEHPAVAMVAVGRKKDELKGEIPQAFVVLKNGATSSEVEILNFCRERLAGYKVPRAVRFVSDLPKTSTGKILRRKLAELDA